MKQINFIFCILLVCSSCNVQKKVVIQNKIPDGKWISVQDSLDVIIVKGEYTFEYYNNILTDTAKYFFSKKSCDTSYKSSKKDAIFLIWHTGGLCYEVEGITDDYMELTYTANKRTLTYWRQH